MARVIRQTTVVRDGYHNAFTGLAWWRGQYWVTYRKGEAHGYRANSVGVIANSCDRHRFEEVARLKTPGDTRDPLPLAMGDERLAVMLPDTVIRGNEAVHRQFISFSENGHDWEPPRQVVDDRHHFFHVRYHDGLWYGLSCWRITPTDGAPRQRRVYLMTSPDLVEWREVCQLGTDEQLLNEADLHFLPDGEMWVILRSLRNPDDSYFASSKPPYTEWTFADLKVRLHCPSMLEHEGRIYVAGRNQPAAELYPAWPFGNSLGIWEVTRGEVKPVLHIPAVGDCAYPGFIHDGAGRVCMTYYSQHAYYMGVAPPANGRVIEGATREEDGYVADVYFAEIELP